MNEEDQIWTSTGDSFVDSADKVHSIMTNGSNFAVMIGMATISSDGSTSTYQQPLILTDDSGNSLTNITNVTWENAQVMGSGVNGEATTHLLSSYFESSDQTDN